MKLEDLRTFTLVKVGTIPTGNLRSDYEWRHTIFYRLENVEKINGLF